MSVEPQLPPMDDFAALHHHERRLGIDWSEVAARLTARHPEWAALLDVPLDSLPGVGIGFDPAVIIPILSSLPDDTGVDGVVRAIDGP